MNVGLHGCICRISHSSTASILCSIFLYPHIFSCYPSQTLLVSPRPFFFYLSFLPVNFMTLPRLMPSVMLPTYTTFLDTIERNFLHLFRGQFYTTT